MACATEFPNGRVSAMSAPNGTVRPLTIGLFSYPRLIHGGGFEEYLIGLGNALSARGHRVFVVTSSASEYRALQMSLNLYYRNPIRSDYSRVTLEELRARLADVGLYEVGVNRMGARLMTADVIYAKNEILDLGVLKLLRPGRLPPIICGVHTPMWFPRALSLPARVHNRLYLGRVYGCALRNIAAVHVSNAHDAALFPSVHRWPAERLFHIPYPYTYDLVGNASGTRARDRERLRIAWAARLTEQKGIDVLLDVVRQLHSGGDAASYVISVAGSGESSHELRLRDAARRFTNLRYSGHVSHDAMREFYAEADVALVTSNWETFPYSCLEPQSLGLPVVATDIPGCRDIVDHARTGFLYEVGCADAAVKYLRMIRQWQRDKPKALDAMRRAAVARVQRHADRSRVTDELEKMFVTVARQRS